MNPKIVCIVGAQEDRWKDEEKKLAKAFIRVFLVAADMEPDRGKLEVISGACPYGGVDIWTREIVTTDGWLPFEEYPPTYNQWEPHGYKERNIMMAEKCTHLLCLDPLNRRSGGAWTAERAARLGKKVTMMKIGRLDLG
jgi:hypothetical protein